MKINSSVTDKCICCSDCVQIFFEACLGKQTYFLSTLKSIPCLRYYCQKHWHLQRN